jgi:hypothetical protein
MLQQKREYLEGLAMKLEPDAVLAHFTRMQVHFKGLESHLASSVGGLHSRRPRFPMVYHRCLSPKEYVRVCLQVTCIQRVARSEQKHLQTIRRPLRLKRLRANVAGRRPKIL